MQAHAHHGSLILMHSGLDTYVSSNDDGSKGFLGDYLEEVFKAIHIEPHWQSVPWEKQLHALKRGAENVCAVSVFKTKEREAYAIFSEPIGVDKGFVLVGRPNSKKLKSHARFIDVLNDNTLTFILQKNTVYNDYINHLLADRELTYSAVSIRRMLHTIINGKNDYVLLTEISAAGHLRLSSLADKLEVYHHYTDIQDGAFYYLACSKNTNLQLLNSVNDEIKRRGIAEPK